MAVDQSELARRTEVALEAIKASLNTDAGEFGALLFVSHHLDELKPTYWQTHLKIDRPDPSQVLGLISLRSHWSDDGDEGLDRLDFGLPGEVSGYVLCVRFDKNGDVEEISLES